MSSVSSSSGRRPGGRSARVVNAVLTATLAELGRVGYGQLRVEDVASRSQVNKTTIYRRWPEKSRLVSPALKTVGGELNDPDTGSVRQDLIASFLASSRHWATPRGRGILHALSAERADPAVDRLARGLRERYRVARRAMLERAIDRGELPADADLDLCLEVLTGAVQTRLRQQLRPLDARWLARVIDFMLTAVRAGVSARITASRVS
jgi:AcrR family transcriptional regulator